MNFTSDAKVMTSTTNANTGIIKMGITAALAVTLFFIMSFCRSTIAYAADAYSIKVNVNTNTVTVYEDEQPVKGMVCSVGANGATPDSGTYYIGEKLRWHHLYGDVAGQYVTRITGHILFHSVPYTEYGNPASLEEGEFDKLGTSASMGCVRLAVADSKWIYDNCDSNTSVTFYSDEDPGPFGYPEVYRTNSASEELRGWDPTDPVEGNPWNETDEKYIVEPEVEEEAEVDTEEENLISTEFLDANADKLPELLTQVHTDINTLNELDAADYAELTTSSPVQADVDTSVNEDVFVEDSLESTFGDEKTETSTLEKITAKEESDYLIGIILGDTADRKNERPQY